MLSSLPTQEEEKFVMGGECVQRVMAAHMLEHWEWALVTKLTAEVKRIYLRVRWEMVDTTEKQN